MKTSRVLAGIIRDLRGYDPLRIILFGSHGRGHPDNDSDIDMVIIKETTRPFLKRYQDIAPYLKNEVPVDLIIYTPGEFEAMRKTGNPFVERVLVEGKVLYEKS